MTLQTRTKLRPAVEVLGPWLLNKGDVLNLNAIDRQIGASYDLAVSSNLGLERPPDSPEVLKIKWRPDYAEFRGAARSLSIRGGLSLMRREVALRLAPDAPLRRKRLLDGRRLVGLLDCSGFAYGDQWGPERMHRRARYYQRLKQMGKKLILLPQAFGPFERSSIREAATAALKRFDLLFARDLVSYEHLLSLDLDPSVISLAPDITHLLLGTPPREPEVWARRVCLVPNARMVDKTSPRQSEAYRGFMARCARQAKERGFEPVFVIHERNDRPLVTDLQGALDFEVPIFDDDALVTKGYLGAAYAVIGSRYHALLSSLSQGTPSIGTSWNHKYEAMFKDYRCPELVLDPSTEPAEAEARIGQLLDPESRERLHKTLSEAAQIQKDRVSDMWIQVENMLEPALAK